MTEKNVHFQSKRHDWRTPIDFFEALDAEFHFTLDAAASDDNALCADWYTVWDNGLLRSWHGTVWCNPPYGEQIGRWIAKAALEAKRGVTTVMLIPARTDTAAWHTHIFGHANVEVRFIKGRLKFDEGSNSAPFPSALVIFRPLHEDPPK